MFCLSRRANVVETFEDDKCFFQNFHALTPFSRFWASGLGLVATFAAAQAPVRSKEAGLYIEEPCITADSPVSHGALPAPRGWVTSAPLQYKELRHE